MNMHRLVGWTTLVLIVLGARAWAAGTPCAISNHYILDPVPCPPSGPVYQTPKWQATGSMSVARIDHSATLLPNGKVLVAGGHNAQGPLDSAELYDPAAETWSPAGRMSRARSTPIATSLADGRVLVTGGTSNGVPPEFGRTNTVDVFDPATGTWSVTGPMNAIRDAHAAVRLKDGKVLAAGGYHLDALASAELYDPGTGTWSPTGALNAARWGHSMTLLADGRVLVAKGSDDPDLTTALASAEIYDPATRKWTRAADSGWGSVLHAATLLATGEVLFTSGNGGGVGGDVVYHTSELFDPQTGAWFSAPDLLEPRYSHSATLLASGAVLVAGGAAQTGHFPNLKYVTRAAVEWFDPATLSWSSAADLGTPRAGHASVLLADGRLLVAGGQRIGGEVYRSAELLRYQLATPPATVIEYRNLPDFPGSPGGHYFYTDDAAEVALLDVGGRGRFTRTGRTFKSGGSTAACRFYGSTRPGPNSHFFTLVEDECVQLKARQLTPPPADAQQWNYEGRTFAADPPVSAPTGPGCPTGRTPVYRAYNNAFAPNGVRNSWDSVHRYATSRIAIDEMVTLFGWRDEGIAFCAQE